MKIQIKNIFNKFNLRTISAAICVSLVSSCAYDAYPVNSSYGGHSPYGGSPYGNTRTVSDPTIPLILGASAIGAIAYYGKKKHDRRHRSNHYYHRDHRNHGHYNHSRYRSNGYSTYRNHNVNHNSYRDNHSSSYHRSNHSSHRNSTSRNSYRNSAREALERKRNSQRRAPQVTRPHHSQVVSTRSSGST